MHLPIKTDLPDGFLNEEVRCEYTVTSSIKAVWAVELDLYNELRRVCDKYNLMLLASGGTILGAARHSGFIPWDDDMDFTMSRKDYIKLCEVAKTEFQSPYFWQTEETDAKSCRGHGQLRNSNTTAILDKEKNICKFNQGIFIDVFPLDNVPDDDDVRHDYLKTIYTYIHKVEKYRELYMGINKSKGIKKIIKALIIQLCKVIPYNNIAYKKLEKLKIQYNNIETRNCAALFIVNINKTDLYVFPQKWYRDYVELPFENTTVKVPVDYIECLERAYGNWKEYVIGGSIHGGIYFDPYKSYKEYM